MVKDSTYWKSLKEYNDRAALSEKRTNEFLEGVTDEFILKDSSPLSRRTFIGLLGASATFAATACKDYHDRGSLVPYNRKPEDIMPGLANYYASTINGYGVLIKTREGRPIKLDGNPEHPINKGKIDNATQASILNFYDPDRLRFPLKFTSESLKFEREFKKAGSWKAIDKEIIDALTKAVASNKEIAIISHSVQSPTEAKLLREFSEIYPSAKVYTYNLFNANNRIDAWNQCYGTKNLPVIKWNEADILLLLEADVLGNEGNVVEQMRMFAERRNVDEPEKFNRLYIAEGALSQTGLNADYRLKLRPEKQLEFVYALISELVNKIPSLARSIPSDTISKFKKDHLKNVIGQNGLDNQTVNHLVNDLINANGKSLVYAGDSLPSDVHIAVNFLNDILGSEIIYNKNIFAVSYFSEPENYDIKSLVNKMNAGTVGAIVHLCTNPVYHLSPDLKYSNALKKVQTIITMTEIENETSSVSHYILPIHHEIESWGDYQFRSGLITLQQPVISPLYTTRQKETILLTWLNKNPDIYSEDLYHKYLMQRWESEVYPLINPAVDFKRFWTSALHDGYITYNEKIENPLVFNYDCLRNLKNKYDAIELALILKNNYTVGDGRYANNGWLLELPHPVSKIVWENYAAIAPDTAVAHGLNDYDLIEVVNGNKKIKIPVFIQPGTASETIVIELGYGRTKAGEVGSNAGFDAINLMNSTGAISNWIYTNVRINKTGECHKLASTQEHHKIDDAQIKDIHKKRDIIREATVKDYLKNPTVLKKTYHELESITPNVKYTGVKWGMAIDLNKCTGCGLCITACNVENNVPVVGKDQVLKGREMQWIRIDRYYSGTPDEPQISLQPMLCQHCDNAPCENVCPVNATNHSPDGLNQMSYNRCVGTRYCSNNCPFKVRRFNFFDFRDHVADGFYYKDSLKLMHNPEVTVRSRGVMEKCTFCIQRIMEARQEATKYGRELQGSDVRTACQDACPTSAITFGDLNDPNSNVSRLRKHNLSHHVLELLNVKPNVTYISKLKNIYSEEEA